MKLLVVFLVLVLGGLIGVALLGILAPMTYSPMMGGWTGMHGRQGMMGQVQEPALWMFVLPFAFIGVAVAGTVGLIYYLVYPPIASVKGEALGRNSQTGVPPANLGAILRTMTEDEKKVIGILEAHGGSCLQKEITKEAGLTRLRTHRIVARLAKRGVLLVTEFGNTNKVSLAEWVSESK